MNLGTIFLLVVLLLISMLDYLHTQMLLSVVLQKCFGTCNKKYCKMSITCRPLNRTSKWSSMDVYFHEGVKIEAPINIEVIAYKKFGTVYRPHMLKLNEEICSAIQLKNHPIYRTFGSQINKTIFGNLYEPCPIEGHRYIPGGPSSPKSYANMPLIPAGEWRIDYKLSKNINNSVEQIVSVSDFYEVKPTSALEF